MTSASLSITPASDVCTDHFDFAWRHAVHTRLLRCCREDSLIMAMMLTAMELDT